MIENNTEKFFITAATTLGIPGGWHVPEDIETGSLPNVTQAKYDEILSEVTRLQAEYDANQYQRDRAEAYPSLTEQADMAYWDRKNGTTTLDDALDAIKAEFPKPE